MSSSIRYNREIVRIFERKCVACHAEGRLAMPLESYHDVQPWARAIREEIFERRMPPWPSASGVRPLANDLSLTTREIAIIAAWVDGGTPRGDAADLPARLPRPIWAAGEPDLKLALPAQRLDGGERPYVRRVAVPTGLPVARWLRGFDIAPGERRALRSVFVSIMKRQDRPAGTRPPASRRLETEAPASKDEGEQWLGGWTPWYAMASGPSDVAYRLPAGAVLTVELHYKTWLETAETLSDSSTLGLYFQPRAPAATLQNLTVTATPVRAGEGRRKLRGELTLEDEMMAWALRSRVVSGGSVVGGSVEVKAVRPDGGIEPLLWVKEDRPDWQLPYVLRNPVRLPRGTRVVVIAYAAASEGSPTAVVSLASYQP